MTDERERVISGGVEGEGEGAKALQNAMLLPSPLAPSLLPSLTSSLPPPIPDSVVTTIPSVSVLSGTNPPPPSAATIFATPRRAPPSSSLNTAVANRMSKAGLSPELSPQRRSGLRASPTKTRVFQNASAESFLLFDLGAAYWKAGMAGAPSRLSSAAEATPRALLNVGDFIRAAEGHEDVMWTLSPTPPPLRLRAERLKAALRHTCYEILGTTPYRRHIAILENRTLSDRDKSLIRQVFFETFQAQSLQFISSHVASLFAMGRTTGLVVDVGHLEASVVPVFDARPMVVHAKTTPKAGLRIAQRLKELLLAYGAYVALPGGSVGPITADLLSNAVLEDIKTRLCFVSSGLAQTCSIRKKATNYQDYLDQIASIYSTHATASTITYKTQTGYLVIPGWIRERACDVLFESSRDDNEDAFSINEIITECLRQLPVDLRKTMAHAMVISGGGAAIPGFFGRLSYELDSVSIINNPNTTRAQAFSGCACHAAPETAMTSLAANEPLTASSGSGTIFPPHTLAYIGASALISVDSGSLVRYNR